MNGQENVKKERYMVNETSKTKILFTEKEMKILTEGRGIDIGCGPDPVTPDVYAFDREQGDANNITQYVHEQFDFVFSSHCLEHMIEPPKALVEWWELVIPGGYLFLIVPDEDLYEQGVFPSRFNRDHKWTFTIAKNKSWSDKSINLYPLVRALPDAEIITMEIQDNGYDRGLCRDSRVASSGLLKALIYVYTRIRKIGLRISPFERIKDIQQPLDQTSKRCALAQIFFLVRKKSS
jgi:SAM-dependent methyltransferase